MGIVSSIKDFIGIEILNNEVKPDASNIFYLVGNSLAIPVYMMLEDYKNQLLAVQQELFSLKYIMKPLGGVGISSAEKYRQQIIDSLGDIAPDRNRIGMDTTAGFDMGDKVLSKLTGHVNFKFAVAQQLGKLSYKFY